MVGIRSDAARSRARILDVAKDHPPEDLRLNGIAREAGLGVGTVYRHFPTVQSLIEALTAETVDLMLRISRDSAGMDDPGEALSFYLRSALTLQLEDGGLQVVMLAPHKDVSEVDAARQEIYRTFADVLDRARTAGAVRADLSIDQLSHLICGIEHAVRLGSPGDAGVLLDVMMMGLRSPDHPAK